MDATGAGRRPGYRTRTARLWSGLASTLPMLLAVVTAVTISADVARAAVQVDQWARHGIVFPDRDCAPIAPDRVEWEVTFTHESGVAVTMPGYHSGNPGEYTVNFMPTRLGNWAWETCSGADACVTVFDNACNALHGEVSTADTEIEAGPFILADGSSPHPGQLVTVGRKWRFSSSGNLVLPLGLRTALFYELEADTTNSPPGNIQFDPAAPEFTAAARFLREMNFIYLETNLYDEEGMYDSNGIATTGSDDKHAYPFSGEFSSYDLDEKLWQRLQDRMDILTAHGLGVQLVMFTDDAGKPAFCGLNGVGWDDCVDDGGVAERLLIRHAVARLAAFPIVIWNHSVDYEDLRDLPGVEAWVAEMRALDPYDHPVSVRHKNETLGTQPEASNQTYDSDGRVIIPKMAAMRSRYVNEPSFAISFDDSWWESGASCINASRRSSPERARRGAWKNLIFGTGAHFRGSDLVGDCGPTGAAVCDENNPQRYYWLETDGSGTSCLEAGVDLFRSDVRPGVAVINALLAGELRTHYASMETENTVYNALHVATGDRNEYATLDPADPKAILVYSLGQDSGSDSDDCPACGGPVTLNLTDATFSERWYQARWIDPRTGVQTDVSPVMGGTIVHLAPPSDPDDDWVLLLLQDTAGGGISGGGGGGRLGGNRIRLD